MRRDTILFAGQMLVRLAATVALALGLGLLAGLWIRTDVIAFHMGAGILALLGIVVVMVRMLTIGHKVLGALLGAIVLGLVGMMVGMTAGGRTGLGLSHMVLMILAVGLTEMAGGKARRATR